MMFRNKSYVKHEIHIYNNWLFSLLSSNTRSFSFPSLHSFDNTPASAALKTAPQTYYLNGWQPHGSKENFGHHLGYVHVERHAHAQISNLTRLCLPVLSVCCKVSAWLWEYTFFWTQQAKVSLLLHLQPLQPKSVNHPHSTLEAVQLRRWKKEWLLRQGPNHLPTPTVIHLWCKTVSISVSQWTRAE